MKKIMVLLLTISLVITCFTACSHSSNDSTKPIDPIENIELDEDEEDFDNEETYWDFDEISLVSEYCNGTWDGSFIFDSEHCASIQNGELWIDCKIAEAIPDMGPYECCFWDHVICTADTGTWVYDQQLGTVELWKNGTRINKVVTSFTDNSLTDVYVLSNCIVARNNTELSVYKFDGYNMTNSKEIIDCHQVDKDTLFYSNFKHQNYKIDGNGEEKLLSTHYVRFNKYDETEMETIMDYCDFPFNKYWNNDSTEDFIIIGNNFYYLDFWGDIFQNNQLIGNIHLGKNQKIIHKGNTLLSSVNHTVYLNKYELLIHQKGKFNNVNIPDGKACILWDSYPKGIVILVYGIANTENDNKLVVVKNNTVDVISEHVVDANVAYDTLYYMENDKVYCLAWQEAEAKPQLFVEGAYAVSQFTDEREGAIVPNKLNNMQEYGEYNLYSPYGTEK